MESGLRPEFDIQNNMMFISLLNPLMKRYSTHLLVIFFIHALAVLGMREIFSSQDPLLKTSSPQNHFLKLQVTASSLPALSSVPKIVSRSQKKIPQENLQKKKLETSKVSETQVPQSFSEQTSLVRQEDILTQYKEELRSMIDRNKSYPAVSRRLGQTGVVVVAFTLMKDGNIINVRLDKPSRYEKLNLSALEAVKKVERFKPIPVEIGDLQMDIKVPVKFVTI